MSEHKLAEAIRAVHGLTKKNGNQEPTQEVKPCDCGGTKIADIRSETFGIGILQCFSCKQILGIGVLERKMPAIVIPGRD